MPITPCMTRNGMLAAIVAFAMLPAPMFAQDGHPGGPTIHAAVVSTMPANPIVQRTARAYSGPKILVSINERRLLYIVGRDTLVDASVGIGKGTDFEYEGQKFRFETPTGRRTVRDKAPDPIWTVPDWHYMEKAARRGLELVRLVNGDNIRLSDGSHIVVRDGQVGRVNRNGYFWPFTPGTEIIFDRTIFMPPFTTAQRKVPRALGPYKLDIGDGYLIHGTNSYNEDSISGAVSHGCIRMANDEVTRLYELVEKGTAVFIY